MRDSKQLTIDNGQLKMALVVAGLFFVLGLTSCERNVLQKKVYDNVIYEVNPVKLYLTNGDKTKQKTSIQYISILHSDLFHSSIPGNTLNEMSEATLSVGDKGIAFDLILQNFLNTTGVDVPTNTDMRSNVSKFVTDTYIKFYLRNPTPYELYYTQNLITNDAGITPQMIYASFILSNEYNFY